MLASYARKDKLRKKIVKLVRDHMGAYLGEFKSGFMPVDSEEHIDLLRKKLIEEAVEYLQDPSIEELADVYEVLSALAVVDLKVTLEEVLDRANQKSNHRGGFTIGKALYMEV